MGNSRERAVRQREYDRGKREAEMANDDYKALISRMVQGAARMGTDLRSALDLDEDDFELAMKADDEAGKRWWQ